MFSSRREAFQFLCSENASDDKKAGMFDKLAFEGFQADEMLPWGWIYKVEGDDLCFLHKDGLFLANSSQASAYFQQHSSAEESNNFQCFLQSMFGGHDQTNDTINNTEMEDTVPDGWSCDGEVVTAPDGSQYSSRLEALQDMITQVGLWSFEF